MSYIAKKNVLVLVQFINISNFYWVIFVISVKVYAKKQKKLFLAKWF